MNELIDKALLVARNVFSVIVLIHRVQRQPSQWNFFQFFSILYFVFMFEREGRVGKKAVLGNG